MLDAKDTPAHHISISIVDKLPQSINTISPVPLQDRKGPRYRHVFKETAEEVERIIDGYRPRPLVPGWNLIQDFVRQAVRDSHPQLKSVAQSMLSVLTYYVLWTREEFGEFVLNRDLIFDPNLITSYAQQRSGTAAYHRSVLLRIARSLCGKRIEPAVKPPLPKSPTSVPYTPKEIAALVVWAEHATTTLRRHNFMTLMCLGFGAGLSTRELVAVTAGDIAVGDDTLHVNVQGLDGVRDIPIECDWAGRLLAYLSPLGPRDYVFRTGILRRHGKDDSHLVTELYQRMHIEGVPRLKCQRMRSTWIVARLQERMNLPELLTTSGLRSYRSLRWYLQFLQDQTAADWDVALRPRVESC